MKYTLLLLILGLFASNCRADERYPRINPAQVLVSSYSAVAGSTVTITISTGSLASPYSSGWSIYLTELHVSVFATANLNGQALPFLCDITGFTNTIYIPMPTNLLAGSVEVNDLSLEHPTPASPSTPVVITCHGGPSMLWDVWVGYYVGP